MALTKNTKSLADYQQWLTADMSNGDILGIEESLGHPASAITIESTGGDTVVRFNVSHNIFKNQEAVGNKILLGPDAAFYDSPVLVDEIEEVKSNVIVEAGAAFSLKDDFPVRDIKIIQLAPSVRITVA